MLSGEVLILSEKLKFLDERQQELRTDLHHVLKKYRAIVI